MDKNKVIVTGFGPFGEHQVNASWESVKLIPSKNLENIELVTEEIAVTYTDVESKIKALWTVHKPQLMVHVGVSSVANLITIETQANRCGYVNTDCNGDIHPTGQACLEHEGDETIHCQINLDQVCKDVNKSYKRPILCTSTNAGRYLCEYIYYKSLNIDNRRTVFVHVPPLKRPFSAQELAEALMHIIKACLVQINCECDQKFVVNI